MWRWQTGLVVAALLLAGSALIGSIANIADEHNEHANDEADRRQADRAAFEQECRFELSIPVSEIQAEKQDALALGLVAVAERDRAGLAAQTERIRDLSRREQAAIAARSGAVETCHRLARERFR